MLNAWKLPALVQATTVVFHQFETGLREGTIYTKVQKNLQKKVDGGQKSRTINRASVPSIISSIDKLIVRVPL